MDRVAPTRRPEGRNAGTQRWRDLLFVHWPVPVDALRPLVPARLELDRLDGVAYVGIVPFAMRAIRPSFLPRALALDFLETNVRTYVHLDGRDPGVYFFSLEASSWLAVQAARWGWSLPYHHATMSMRRDGDAIDYRSARRGGPAGLTTRWAPGEPLGPSRPGSAEHFLLERYVLYAERRGGLVRGRVHHPPYPARSARVDVFEESLLGAAGLPPASGPPAFAHASDGVDVEVFALERV